MKNIFLLLISVIIITTSCNNQNNVREFKFSEIEPITGLASPVNLNPDTATVFIKDYFPENYVFDSITANKYLKLQLSDDSLQLKIIVTSDSLPKLSVLKFYLLGIEQDILLKKSEKIKYEFSFNPEDKKYKKVQIKGEMNAWNPNNTNLKFENGIWKTEIIAEPGNYQYLIVADGKEMLDLANPVKISNGMGGFNSVMKIGKTNNTELPYIFTKLTDDNLIFIGFKNNIKQLVILYKNFELSGDFITKSDTAYRIIIPGDARDQNRTFVRVYAANDSGFSDDLLIPLEKGKVVNHVRQLTRTDFEAATIYNVFIDRFFDGDSTNDRPTPDKRILPKANYFGGDIKGITDKIKSGYFQNLGINTIWISPIVKNVDGAYGNNAKPKTKFSAYHGYWPVSFTLIDSHFGTERDFKELVKTAHENNMNVLLDFVANHVHKEHPYYKQHPENFTQLHLPDGTLNLERWDDHRLTTWFDTFLPSLDLTKPEVYNMLSDSAVYWIKKYNLDGFRHDATKHIPNIFWQTLTQKIKTEIEIPEKRRIYQIGETYGSPELIASYVNTGQLNAQFDFNVYDAFTQAVAGNSSFTHLIDVMKTSFKYYGYHNLMGNITGNQDRGRFISYAGGSLRFNEDAKLAGWTRDIEVGNPVAYKKSAQLAAFISTIPGIPVIYYGDEIGMPGGNDPDNRRMMKFNNLNIPQNDLKATFSALLSLRRNSLPLIYGDFKFLKCTDDILIYQRTYFDQIFIIALNKTNQDYTAKINIDKRFDLIKLHSEFSITFKENNNTLEFTIPANGFAILSNKP
ncbi:MAG: alpha-amylase [Chlorobi bacterium]|nr:alpha-amylase [Chlorobiota bacterium]